MASGFGTQYTMLEVAKSIGADGRQLAVVDTISFETPMLEEGAWFESDDFNSHHFNQVLSKPHGTDVQVNLGYNWENPVLKPVTITLQGVAVNTKIDVEILATKRDPQAWRAAQEMLTVSGIKNTVHDRSLYGNSSMFPRQIDGVWTQFPLLASGGQMGPSVTDNGGRISGVNTGQSSTYSMKWGPGACYFVYPRGGRGFISITDGGKQLVPDLQTPPQYFWAMVTTYMIRFGLVVEDPRYIQRLANIDTVATWGTPNPALFPGAQANDAAGQITAYSQFPGGLDGVVSYAPRSVWTQMNVALERKQNVWLGMEEAWGRRVLHCHGVPVKLCERILPLNFVAGDINPFTGVAYTTPTTQYEPVAS
jgi:hypothetical protein